MNKGSIRVAFASNNNVEVDAHFGKTKQFSIYEVSRSKYTILDLIKIVNQSTDETISLLKECDIVYFLDIGATAAAKVIRKGIFPIKYKEVIRIDDEVNKLMKMLAHKPPPFIKKIIEKQVA